MTSVVIFCQAPAKVPHALACYEEHVKRGESVGIVVVNVEAIYKFLQSLNLDVDFIKYIPNVFEWSKNPVKLICNLKAVVQIARDLDVKNWSNIKIFFSCICNDLTTHALLSILQKCNSVSYIHNEIDDVAVPTNRLNLLEHVKKLIFMALFGNMPLEMYKVDGSRSFGIRREAVVRWYPNDIHSTISRYAVHLNEIAGRGRKVALIYSNPYRDPYTTQKSYTRACVDVVRKLRDKGYRIIGKGHPRLGALPELKELTDEILADYLPAEFLDISGIDVCVGLTSTSICDAAKRGVRSYSFLPLLEITKKDVARYWYDYLNHNSNGLVEFIKDLEAWDL